MNRNPGSHTLHLLTKQNEATDLRAWADAHQQTTASVIRAALTAYTGVSFLEPQIGRSFSIPGLPVGNLRLKVLRADPEARAALRAALDIMDAEQTT